MNIVRIPASKSAGFSIVELSLVLTIISILLVIAALAFNQWMVKSKIESQVREMAADLSNLRVKALTTKQRHSIMLHSGNYVFKSYSSEGEDITKGEYVLGGTHRVSYNLKKNSSSNYSGEVFEIDTRGMIDTSLFTENVIPIYVESKVNASLDCINVHAVRVNTGKWDSTGEKCDDK